MKPLLLDKNALIGGASAGIGRAVAVELASMGANVCLMARTEKALAEVTQHLDQSHGQTHRYLVVDYTQPEQLIQKVSDLASFMQFHILINNTGGPAGGPITTASESDFLAAYQNHLLCNHKLMQILLPGMKAAGFGRIVNIISTSVKEPIEGLGVSNSTRWAVAGWAKTLAGELGQFGITVNNVLPGFTETARLEEIIAKRAEKSGATSEQVAAEMKNQVPLRRFATAQEVAFAVAFLASPLASYINGVNLPVDGGRTKSL